MDYAGHDKTYWMFRQLMKYTWPARPLILALLACFCG
jgi:Bacterial aa3 type cytochrome c oxidase subunit IV